MCLFSLRNKFKPRESLEKWIAWFVYDPHIILYNFNEQSWHLYGGNKQLPDSYGKDYFTLPISSVLISWIRLGLILIVFLFTFI